MFSLLLMLERHHYGKDSCILPNKTIIYFQKSCSLLVCTNSCPAGAELRLVPVAMDAGFLYSEERTVVRHRYCKSQNQKELFLD